MKFISLFAGIGGFDLGFERAWMKCVAQVEKDPFCLRVLAKHWPDVERFEDVREFGKHNAPTADLVCGGFPCQPHSLAGKRKGAADDRDLWPEYRRIIGELKPRWVVAENVPGIRTTILDDVLSDLESLDYSTRTLIIPACAFNAPHRRERLFIIAHPQSFAGRLSVSAGYQKENPYARRDGSKWSVANSKYYQVLFDEQSNKANTESSWSSWWAIKPGVCGVAYGVPARMDRLRSLGNAVVPQVAEFIGRAIMQVEAEYF